MIRFTDSILILAALIVKIASSKISMTTQYRIKIYGQVFKIDIELFSQDRSNNMEQVAVSTATSFVECKCELMAGKYSWTTKIKLFSPYASHSVANLL